MATIELQAGAAPGVEQMLTREQVAEHLDVSVSTVKKLCKDGDLRAVNVGRQVRIRASDFQTYIDNLGR
jgi:excisionase family DNA binding protein